MDIEKKKQTIIDLITGSSDYELVEIMYRLAIKFFGLG